MNGLNDFRASTSTVVFFETPHRIQRTLTELPKYFGNRPICVARELTKVHQELIVGDAASVIGRMTNYKGEFTVVVGPAVPQPSMLAQRTFRSEEELYGEFCRMTNSIP